MDDGIHLEARAVVPDRIAICNEVQLRSIATGTNRELGDYWRRGKISAVLRVASAVVPHEHIFLLNPEHPDFVGIEVGETIPFRFDPRLFG